MSRSDSVSSQRKLSISVPPPPPTSSMMLPTIDAPFLSASPRHFELPVVVEEDDDKSEVTSQTMRSEEVVNAGSQTQRDQEQLNDDVFSALNQNSSGATRQAKLGSNPCGHKLIDASTQTSINKSDDSEWLSLKREILYQFVPLPPSNNTTPSVSHCNLDNY